MILQQTVNEQIQNKASVATKLVLTQAFVTRVTSNIGNHADNKNILTISLPY